MNSMLISTCTMKRVVLGALLIGGGHLALAASDSREDVTPVEYPVSHQMPPDASQVAAIIKSRPGNRLSMALRNRTFTDHNGESFTLSDFKSKTVVLNFIFTHCPSVCPVQMSELRKVQKRLASADADILDRVMFVSISITPETDTPERLQAFAKSLKLDLNSWRLARPKQVGDELEALSDLLDVQAGVNKDGIMDHKPTVYLLNAKSHLAGRYKGNPLDLDRIELDIRNVDKLF